MARSESRLWKCDGLCLISIAPEQVVPKDDQFAIVVLTSETVETILSHGGTGDWVLSPKKAGTCKYVVCCRKPAWNNKKEGIARRAAFLIGLIVGLRKKPDSENDRNQPRFLIELSEYATFEREDAWKEGRNPVAYKPLKALGIDLRGLKFKPMPVPAPSAKSGDAGSAPMTIADAKKALAASFGVSPDDVEITIRG
jgi:hypothetical protein